MKKYVNVLKGFCVGNFMLMLSYIIIYLSDGNTVYMSEISKLTNFKFMLSQFISSGLTYVIVYATIILSYDLFKNDSENPTIKIFGKLLVSWIVVLIVATLVSTLLGRPGALKGYVGDVFIGISILLIAVTIVGYMTNVAIQNHKINKALAKKQAEK